MKSFNLPTAGNFKYFTAIMNLRFIEARGVRKSLRHVIVVFMPDVKIKDGGS